MGLFTKKQEGGMMDVIRCNEEEYLVWKWSPSGENAISYDAKLSVKNGEVAAFVYKTDTGMTYDFIVGPVDATIKTADFPVLSRVAGADFGGSSPFSAEVYFINLSESVRIPYFFPGFDIEDTNLNDYPVQVSCKGDIIVNIIDYKKFFVLNRIYSSDVNELKFQISNMVRRYLKSAVTNAPRMFNTPVAEIESCIDAINAQVLDKVKSEFEIEFGFNIKGLNTKIIQTQ